MDKLTLVNPGTIEPPLEAGIKMSGQEEIWAILPIKTHNHSWV